MSETKRLQNKIAVVTGAAAGIGKAIAAVFAREGASVYLTDINGAAAEEAAESIRSAGQTVTAMTVDVCKGQDVTALFRNIDSGPGRIDVLVNNAGLNVREDFRHLSDADWVKILF